MIVRGFILSLLCSTLLLYGVQDVSLQYAVPISPAQVNNSKSYTISSPGTYFLTEHLGFYPIGYQANDAITNNASIYINSDNVILNLNNKTISHISTRSGNPKLQTNNIAGIRIASGAKNVTVCNGTINYVTGSGILIEPNCSNIILDTITVLQTARSGIHAAGTSGNTIQDITMHNCHASNCTGTLLVNAPTEIYGTGNAYGVELSYVENGTMNNCSSNNHHVDTSANSLSDATSHAAGIACKNCRNIAISNTLCNSNSGPQGTGIYMQDSYNISCHNCTCHENTTSLPTGQDATTEQSASGFRLTASSYCSFTSCYAHHNTTDSMYGVGFFLDGLGTANSNYNSFVQCQAIQNSGGNHTTKQPIGAGFLSTGKDNTHYNVFNTFMHCTAKGNVSQKNIAAGICMLYESGSVIEQCACIGNGDVTSSNTTNQTTDGGTITIPTVYGYGIYLGPEGLFTNPDTSQEYDEAHYTYTKNIIIADCLLYFNSHIGLKDDAKDSQSLIMRNKTFRNGTQNQVLSQGNIPLYAANFMVQYIQSSEHLSIASATVGGFGALNVANPYDNIEWQVASDHGQTQWPAVQGPATTPSIHSE